jgi:16S rRNA processing protein RimM
VESLAVFEPGKEILTVDPQRGKATWHVKWVEPYKRMLRMALKRIETIDDAQGLIGSEIWTQRDRLPELEEEGAYYWADLIGLSVCSVSGEHLGRIDSIFPTGSNDVFVVKDGDREILVPAIASVVVKVDLEGKMVCVDLPDGL